MKLKDFFKRKKGSNDGNASSDGQIVAGASSNKKPKDRMSSVIHEGVVSSSVDIMKQNEKFIIKDEKDHSRFVTLFLNVNDIGGLSKRDSKNQDKGALVQAINTNTIKTMISAQMLEDENIIFIPTNESLQVMQEHSLLRNALYKWALVNENGDYVLDDLHAVEFNDAMAINNGDPVEDYISEDFLSDDYFEDDDDYEEILDDDYAEINGTNDYDTDEEEIVDDNLYVDDDPFDDYDQDEFLNDDYDTDEEEIVDDNHDESYDEDYDEDYDENEDSFEDYSDYGDDEYFDPVDGDDVNIEVSEETYKQTVERVLFKNDLDLVVTSELFDDQFGNFKPNYTFEENQGDNWIDNYLSQMAKDANRDLEKLLETNVVLMRNKYMNTLSRYAGQIEQELDFHNPATKYGDAFNMLEDSKAEQLSVMDEKIREEVSNIESDWNKKLDDIADAAAKNARIDYERKYGYEYEDKKANVRKNILDVIETSYQLNYAEVNNQRKMIAQKKLDLAQTQVLRIIASDFENYLKREEEIYNVHQRKMNQFLEENRKNDVIRTETLRKELDQNNRAEAIRTDYQARLDSLNSSISERERQLNNQIEDLTRQNTRRIEEIQKSHKDEIDRLNKDKVSLSRQIEDLIDKYSQVDMQKAREYQMQIDNLKDDNKHWRNVAERSDFSIRRYFIVAIGMSVLIGLASGLLGYNLGNKPNVTVDNTGNTKANEQVMLVDKDGKELPKNDNGDYVIKDSQGNEVPLNLSDNK